MATTARDSCAASPENNINSIANLRSVVSSLIVTSTSMQNDLSAVGLRLSSTLQTLSAASDIITPLHSQSIAASSLRSRIDRAVPPTLSLLRALIAAESLQHRLHRHRRHHRRGKLKDLLSYAECIQRVQAAVDATTEEWGPAVRRVQEAVEFVGRTGAVGPGKTRRLREAVDAAAALWEEEVEAMKYEGPLDAALLQLQDEFEALLLSIKHRNFAIHEQNVIAEEDNAPIMVVNDLGTEMEVEILKKISETLAANDCLDICIDIYVKSRYRRAAKALMRLDVDYLRSFSPDDLDNLDWNLLESSIAFWTHHVAFAVSTVLAAEDRLCCRILSSLASGELWPHCSAKIADRIAAVFFRFGEGVARSTPQPHKLFKLLDMLITIGKITPELGKMFAGESGGGTAGEDIRLRLREMKKLIVKAAAKAFAEFGLRVEGGGAPPSSEGTAVAKVVRYAVNYLKCLVGEEYGLVMEQVLRTERAWRSNGSTAEEGEMEEKMLGEAVSNVLDALQRDLEAKRSSYKDEVAGHVFAMNSYWYIYMRTKGSDIADLVGEEYLKNKFKSAAESAAFLYQSKSWAPLLDHLLLYDSDERIPIKLDLFMKDFEDKLKKHRSVYSVPDEDLRDQIKEAVADLVVPAYTEFLDTNSASLRGMTGAISSPESIRGLLMRLFDGGGGNRDLSEAARSRGGASRSKIGFGSRRANNSATGPLV